MTIHDLRQQAGHTQQQAAAYLYCTTRTIQRIENSNSDPARLELYRLKLERDGVLVGEGGE